MNCENPVIFIEMDYGILERTGRLRNAAAVPLHGHRTAHTANGIGIDKFISTTAVEWMICSAQRDLRICPPEAGISALSSDTGNPLNAYRR
ncbi:hypothetical protein WR25_25185 [Diploscapter pachys]|uniref:Uncharacterized protein n=1 Tax=Diploscapter pachys TaxID=2018661 RepID=A0A2A2JA60_9BILA|nr:hypothetical protein WR25_25185 [Diploscapter pachys]